MAACFACLFAVVEVGKSRRLRVENLRLVESKSLTSRRMIALMTQQCESRTLGKKTKCKDQSEEEEMDDRREIRGQGM